MTQKGTRVSSSTAASTARACTSPAPASCSRASSGGRALKTNKQTNKYTNRQINENTNKQISKYNVRNHMQRNT